MKFFFFRRLDFDFLLGSLYSCARFIALLELRVVSRFGFRLRLEVAKKLFFRSAVGGCASVWPFRERRRVTILNFSLILFLFGFLLFMLAYPFL